MDKNNGKVNIIVPVPYIWQHNCMLHIPPTKVLSSPNRSKKEKRDTQKSLSENGGSGKKRKKGQENGPKAAKDKTKRATRQDRRAKEEIWKSGIKLAEIPGRGID